MVHIFLSIYVYTHIYGKVGEVIVAVEEEEEEEEERKGKGWPHVGGECNEVKGRAKCMNM